MTELETEDAASAAAGSDLAAAPSTGVAAIDPASPDAAGAVAEGSDSEIPDSDSDSDSESDAPLRGVRLLEREGDLAADYLETLLDIADLDGDIDMDIEGERATVDVVGKELGALVGSTGETLDALQELTRLAVQRETGVRSRLMLDIGGFRARRRTALQQVALAATEEVRRTGAAKSLEPMTPFERKVVHDAVAGVEGLLSESEGEEPHRFVVVRPG